MNKLYKNDILFQQNVFKNTAIKKQKSLSTHKTYWHLRCF